MKLNKKDGIVLISALILISILLMIVTSMTLIATQNYNLAGILDKRAKALRAAETGIEYALYQLNKDTDWSVGADLSVDMHFSRGETAKILASGFRNNLKGGTSVGTTPPYCAEILSEGFYKGQKIKMKAIFVREDIFSYPLASDGTLYMLFDSYNTTATIAGKENSGGRIHTNDKMVINAWYFPSDFMSLNGGFISTVQNLEYTSCSSPGFEYKEYVAPSQIVDIDIEGVIENHKPDCHTVAGDRFYLIGYFEYSSGNYCIPHEGPNAVAPETAHLIPDYWDQVDDNMVYTHPYTYGIASFPEDSTQDFLDKYRELMNIGPNISWVSEDISPPRNANNSKNLYDYYSGITFAELGTSQWDNMITQLGMSYTTEVIDGITVVTLVLNDDIYSPGSLGFFDTLRFDCYATYVDGGGGGNIGDARIISYVRPKVKINLNNKNIFSDGELSLPTIDNGAAVSAESVYLAPGYDSTMTVLAENDIGLCIKDQTPNRYYESSSDLNLNGVLYAKDNIYINTLSWPQCMYNINLTFRGSIQAKEKTVNNAKSYPRSSNWYQTFGNITIEPDLLNEINIIHTTDGLGSLVDVRMDSFRVRKILCSSVN